MKEKKRINIGAIVKKTSGPGLDKTGSVVALGSSDAHAILTNWVRLRYTDGSGYEWIQKSSLQLIANARQSSL